MLTSVLAEICYTGLMPQHHYIDWFFKNKQGKWKIIQLPNILLGTWLVLSIALFFIHKGQLREGLALLRSAVLFTWAYLEITNGDSRFRRTLGVIVMLFIIKGYF
jgi:hypothetical protein